MLMTSLPRSWSTLESKRAHTVLGSPNSRLLICCSSTVVQIYIPAVSVHICNVQARMGRQDQHCQLQMDLRMCQPVADFATR